MTNLKLLVLKNLISISKWSISETLNAPIRSRFKMLMFNYKEIIQTSLLEPLSVQIFVLIPFNHILSNPIILHFKVFSNLIILSTDRLQIISIIKTDISSYISSFAQVTKSTMINYVNKLGWQNHTRYFLYILL